MKTLSTLLCISLATAAFAADKTPSELTAAALMAPTDSLIISTGSPASTRTITLQNLADSLPKVSEATHATVADAATTATTAANATNLNGLPVTSFLKTNDAATIAEVNAGVVADKYVTPYNLQQKLTPVLPTRFRSILAKSKLGLTNAVVVFVGDSTTVGYGSGVNGWTNCVQGSTVARLADKLGGRFTSDGFIGSHVFSTHTQLPFSYADSKAVFPTNWTAVPFHSMGGDLIGVGIGTTNAMTYTPSSACDFVTVYYFNFPGNGAFAVYDGANKLGDVLTGQSIGNVSTNKTFVTTLTNHVFSLVPYATNTATLYLQGLICGTQTNSVTMVNAGWESAGSTDWENDTGQYFPLTALKRVPANLFVLELALNDIRTSVSVGTFTTNLSAIVAALTNSADVLLVNPVPGYSTATLAPFISAIRSVADYYAIPVLDKTSYFKSQSDMSAAGMMFDTLHPNAAGYMDAVNIYTPLFP